MGTAYLKSIIEILQGEDSSLVLPHGFGRPHSYRGYYDNVAFEPEQNVTVGDALKDARSAVDATFVGYKGGDFTMNEYTTTWLADYGDTGETLGPRMLRLMIELAKRDST